MRKIFILTALLVSLAAPALADTIRAGVNGLVCSFCAAGIEKTFKKQAAVRDVKVDLDTKLVTIHTKKGKSLDDKTITSLINDAGYSVTAIKREK
jgi:mercuric ion binding protein